MQQQHEPFRLTNDRNTLVQELKEELSLIIQFWITQMPDPVHGGFAGSMSSDGVLHTDAPKGAVLNARILWTLSAAAKLTGDKTTAAFADKTFEYFSSHFLDESFGGVYWSIDQHGQPLDTKKQVYAQSFAVYGLSEYFALSKNKEALSQALLIYDLIEKHGRDKKLGGYFEAFDRQWKPMDDLRLSAKDANEKKTMNTHLHMLEAFINLLRVFPDEKLKQDITALLHNFSEHIIDKASHRQGLFFDEQWQRKDTLVSFGHDIEASWLLQEAAETMGDEQLVAHFKTTANNMVNAVLPWLDSDGGLWYELDAATQHLVREKHWWPQAEAMVGFCNAWQNTGEPHYFQRMLKSWEFIKNHIINQQLGEWWWGVNDDYSPMLHEDFAGTWKCPYHNGRACMEVIKRLSE